MKIVAVACFVAYVCSVIADEEVAGDSYTEASLEEAQASAQKALTNALAESVKAAGEFANAKSPPDNMRTHVWCPKMDCSDEYLPVCGFSFCAGSRTFSNMCEFKEVNRCTFPGYVFLFKGRCEKIFRCPIRSIFVPEPDPMPYPFPLEVL